MALRMRHRVALLLAASVGLSLVYTGSALAATQWVNDDPSVGTNTSCANPGFNAIQPAVSAAVPGDIIMVCSGVYSGGVTVDRRLTIRGAKWGKDARTRTTAGESIVQNGGLIDVGFKLVANQVTLDGFTIRTVTNGPGIETSPAFSGYTVANNIINNNAFGIYANSGSAFQNVIRTNNIRFNNANLGVASGAGNGIYADQGTNRLLITRNALRGQKNSGFLFTNVDPVQNNNVTIQFNQSLNNSTFVNLFRNNSNFQIRQNSTNDTIIDDNVDQGTAIRIADNANGVVVANNTIRNSPFSGVAVRDMEFSAFNPDNIDIQFNRILNPEGNGVDVTDKRPGAVSVFRNTIRGADLDGIFFAELTSNNFINTNNAKFSGNFDCQDQSHDGTGTDGTSNTWTNNVGPVADPGGICHN